MDVDLHDWEVLDDDLNDTVYLDGIERVDSSSIRSDHFSIHSPNYTTIDHVSQIHPNGSDDTRAGNDDDDESLLSDSREIEPKYTVYETVEDEKFVEQGDNDNDNENENQDGLAESMNTKAGNSELCVVNDDVSMLSDSREIESNSSVYEKVEDEKIVEVGEQGDNGDGLVEGVKADGVERNKVGVAVWWKVPFDLLKYCLFKASPVWTLSVAAAMMGVVILGRRLYRMKRKTRTLQLKLAVDDDKKVSQVMSRAARLNEAFSVVKRAPIIRPSLPAADVSPWAMMALK